MPGALPGPTRSLRPMTAVLLVHGGFAPLHTGSWFWTETGVSDGLESRGLTVLVPDRISQPASWAEEGAHLAEVLMGDGGEAAVVVGASNGCSAAARLALDYPGLVVGVVLCWPATAGDAEVDMASRAVMADFGLASDHLDLLYSGETLRGVRDVELATLSCPVVIIPSDPHNPQHQERTGLLHVRHRVDRRPTPREGLWIADGSQYLREGPRAARRHQGRRRCKRGQRARHQGIREGRLPQGAVPGGARRRGRRRSRRVADGVRAVANAPIRSC